MRVMEPFSLNDCVPLPKNFPKVLNLLDYRVSEVGSVYVLELVDEAQAVLPSSNKVRSSYRRKGDICYGENGKIAVMAVLFLGYGEREMKIGVDFSYLIALHKLKTLFVTEENFMFSTVGGLVFPLILLQKR